MPVLEGPFPLIVMRRDCLSEACLWTVWCFLALVPATARQASAFVYSVRLEQPWST